MGANYTKEVRKEMMRKEIEQNPGILSIRRRILVLMIVWVISRVIVMAVEIVGALQGMWDFQTSNLVGIAVMAIFAAGVYAGERALAFLPILGGVWMLVQWFRYDYLYLMISDEFYPIARIYATLFLVTALLQLAVFLYLRLSKGVSPLFDANKRAVDAARRVWNMRDLK